MQDGFLTFLIRKKIALLIALISSFAIGFIASLKYPDLHQAFMTIQLGTLQMGYIQDKSLFPKHFLFDIDEVSRRLELKQSNTQLSRIKGSYEYIKIRTIHESKAPAIEELKSAFELVKAIDAKGRAEHFAPHRIKLERIKKSLSEIQAEIKKITISHPNYAEMLELKNKYLLEIDLLTDRLNSYNKFLIVEPISDSLFSRKKKRLFIITFLSLLLFGIFTFISFLLYNPSAFSEKRM